jgi:uncharacterized membrane protein
MDLPLVTYAFYALGIAHAEITNLADQRLDLLPTAVFPMLVPWLICALRWKDLERTGRIAALILSIGTPALIILNTLGNPRVVLDNHMLRQIYEGVAILNTVFLMLHARHWGQERILFFLGPALIYGIVLENGGIILGYFTEMHYNLYAGPLPAPLATMSGWVTVFYIITWVTWELQGHIPALTRVPIVSALVAVAAALCFDFQIDPIATAVGFWQWHPTLDDGWLGVPLLNYVAWGAAVFPFAWLLFRREHQQALAPGGITAPDQRRWMLIMIPLALLVAAVLFFSGMTLVEGGFSGPTFIILGEFFTG